MGSSLSATQQSNFICASMRRVPFFLSLIILYILYLTIQVWKTGPPVSQKYNRAMKELFRWQYTQFSQFNTTDTLLLVSGVHFGPNSTSGEIAVFNLKGKDCVYVKAMNLDGDILPPLFSGIHFGPNSSSGEITVHIQFKR